MKMIVKILTYIAAVPSIIMLLIALSPMALMCLIDHIFGTGVFDELSAKAKQDVLNDELRG